EGSKYYEGLSIDLDRDGTLNKIEMLWTTHTEQRGKLWSSFRTEVWIPLAGAEPGSLAVRKYPLDLWLVEDPAEPGATPELRWSRRGWHEGQLDVGGKPAFVLITELEMDGVF